MVEPAMLLAVGYVACVAGFAWLALGMEPHWQQVQGARQLSQRGRVALRTLGVLGLVGGGLACARADHASMAMLVWVLMLTAAALTVTFVLSGWPAALRPFAAVVGFKAATPSVASDTTPQ
jgi:Protein of unknown function (DUF3325)